MLLLLSYPHTAISCSILNAGIFPCKGLPSPSHLHTHSDFVQESTSGPLQASLMPFELAMNLCWLQALMRNWPNFHKQDFLLLLKISAVLFISRTSSCGFKPVILWVKPRKQFQITAQDLFRTGLKRASHSANPASAFVFPPHAPHCLSLLHTPVLTEQVLEINHNMITF